mgnify:CR=1 FL=1
MRNRIGMMLGTLMLAVTLLVGCGGGAASQPSGSASSSGAAMQAASAVKITMLNVGQGDSILIKTPNQTVLIDTGDVDEREKLTAELNKAGVKKIDKVILTHPHADHIGGMDVVLKDHEVGTVYDNGMPSTSKLYIGYMKQLKAKNIKHETLKTGDKLDFGGGVSFEVLYPTADLQKKGQDKGYKHDPNNESIVGRLVYGDFSMLFTGDAETPVEEAILKANGKVKSTILKAPHHGSSTSASPEYLKAVWPEAVLISCGVNNDYGHPHAEVLARYKGEKTFTDRKTGKTKNTKLVKNDKGETLAAKTYETDKDGTITVTTDGKKYEIQTGGTAK